MHDNQEMIASKIATEFSMQVSPNQYDTAFVEIDGIDYDSLRVLELISLTEEMFNIEIDLVADDPTYSFRSISNICSLVNRKLQSTSILLAQ